MSKPTHTGACELMTNSEHDRLQGHVDSIAETLNNPPYVNDDGEELPDDAVEVDPNVGDYTTRYVTDWDRKVPAEEFNDDEHHTAGIYLYDDDDDTWTSWCGEAWSGQGSEWWWSEDGDLILGRKAEVIEAHPMSAMDYLQDVLDIEYHVGGDGEYRSGRVMVSCGGPNIWVDTGTKTVEGYWWGDRATASFSDDIGLDDALEELWGCR